MKTLNITSADIITKAGIEPFVGLTVNVNGKQEQIARTCKQALLDLHKSARASNIPSGLFDNGVASANPLLYNKFREAIIGLVGKVAIADVEFYEAGSEYIATEVSSAVKAGTAAVGDTLLTEKKGSRIEGFVNIPLTNVELARREMIESLNPAAIMQALMGIDAPIVEAPKAALPTAPVVDETAQQAFGNFTPEDLEEVEATEAPKAGKSNK